MHQMPQQVVGTRYLTPVGHERAGMPLRKRIAMDIHLQSCCFDSKFLPAAVNLQVTAKVVTERGYQWVGPYAGIKSLSQTSP